MVCHVVWSFQKAEVLMMEEHGCPCCPGCCRLKRVPWMNTGRWELIHEPRDWWWTFGSLKSWTHLVSDRSECHQKEIWQYHSGHLTFCNPMKEILHWLTEAIRSPACTPGTRTHLWGAMTTTLMWGWGSQGILLNPTYEVEVLWGLQREETENRAFASPSLGLGCSI